MAWQKALRDIITHDRHYRAKAAKRWYARGEAPQRVELPYAVYQGIGETANTAHQQGVGDLYADDVLVVAIADDYSEAVELLTTIRSALLGQKGTFDGEELLGVFSQSKRTDAEPAADEAEERLQAASMVITVWHREA